MYEQVRSLVIFYVGMYICMYGVLVFFACFLYLYS